MSNKNLPMSNQLESFNLQFVKDAMNQWTTAATSYEREAEKAYTKMRSYLTLYQFRLSEEEKYNIRETLSQCLDEIDKMDLVDDMDNYLDGFCFKLDRSVIPNYKKIKPIPKAVQIEIAPQPSSSTMHEQMYEQSTTHQPTTPQPIGTNMQETIFSPANSPVNFNETAMDYNNLDFYTMQFFQ